MGSARARRAPHRRQVLQGRLPEHRGQPREQYRHLRAPHGRPGLRARGGRPVRQRSVLAVRPPPQSDGGLQRRPPCRRQPVGHLSRSAERRHLRPRQRAGTHRRLHARQRESRDPERRLCPGPPVSGRPVHPGAGRAQLQLPQREPQYRADAGDRLHRYHPRTRRNHALGGAAMAPGARRQRLHFLFRHLHRAGPDGRPAPHARPSRRQPGGTRRQGRIPGRPPERFGRRIQCARP